MGNLRRIITCVRVRLTACNAASIVRKILTESRTLANFDLDELEQQVNALIELNQRLRDENNTLRTRHDALAVERDDLLDKTTLTRSRIEAMLVRLRTLETQL